MRICFFGDGPWATIALKQFLKHDQIEVAMVVLREKPTDPELSACAEERGINVQSPAKVNEPEFLVEIQRQRIELGVSLSYNQIFRAPAMNAFPMGIINCHAGKLPFYRGRNILNWALINGETEFGVTIHYVDEGIDTGDIILQRIYPIEPEDDYQRILTVAQEACGPLLLEALLLLAQGEAQPQPQTDIHPVGFYCGGRTFGDEWLDWSWPSERIHNFVRGVTPPALGAHTLHADRVIAVLKTELINDAPNYIGTPGEVIGREDEGVIVKTGDSTIRIQWIADYIDGRLTRHRTPRHAIGVRFGLNLMDALVRLQQRVKELESNFNS